MDFAAILRMVEEKEEIGAGEFRKDIGERGAVYRTNWMPKTQIFDMQIFTILHPAKSLSVWERQR
jgi:hypothetical protein